MKLAEDCAVGRSIARDCLFFAFPTAKCHSIWRRERLLLSVTGCTCRLNRFDTIRRKYEAVKEDLEVQKRKILLWQSQAQAQAQLQPHPQRVSCDCTSQSDSSMEKLAV